MKPILFNTEMVRAILDGRKTVTRRVVKGAIHEWDFVGIEERPCERRVKANGTEYPKELNWPHAVFSAGDGYYDYPMIKVPYRPGDILYVRETWGDYSECYPGGAGFYIYRADHPDGAKTDTSWDGVVYDLPRWRPSIHMPKEAARLFLRVKAVRVERLQDTTANSAMDEGFTDWNDFVRCWDSTIKPADRVLYGWAANHWVWVIEFERISKEEAL